MRLEEQLMQALLEPSPQLPVGIKVFPNYAPQGTVTPYVILRRITTVPETGIAGRLGLDRVRMQVDCYAKTLSQAVSVAHQVRLVIESIKTEITYMPLMEAQEDDYFPDLAIHVRSSDYMCWEQV
jgi:uncharacterized protein DUF3168